MASTDARSGGQPVLDDARRLTLGLALAPARLPQLQLGAARAGERASDHASAPAGGERCGCGSRARTAFLALGSNLGPREATLLAAASALQERGLRITARSSLYLTEPVGGPAQEWFVNQVLAGETRLCPQGLLAACQEVERAFGRVRAERNGPRTLDVDVLMLGDLVRDDERLVLPHPRLAARRFVLVPLAEIAPLLVHPRLGLEVRELLARCDDRSRVLLRAQA